MTKLAELLGAEIRANGPISVSRFMAGALGHATHGYYMTRDPLGISGDFTTAPEISQVFGEINGLFLAEQWRGMGSPAAVSLVELGPGRGTLMSDLLRALRVLPACREAVTVHLVETSQRLREAQRLTLAKHHPDIVPQWHDRLETVPSGPLLLIANEFFDALPIRQFQFDGKHWREIMVGLTDSGQFTFVPGSIVPSPCPNPSPTAGALFETCEPGLDIAQQIGNRLSSDGGCAVIVDYGHLSSGFGDTLQAVRSHWHVPALDDPGEADITAHVDFQSLGLALTEAGAHIAAAVTQGEFLLAHGVALRETALTKNKPLHQAAEIRGAIRRLIDPAGMGKLFKVMVATSSHPAPGQREN